MTARAIRVAVLFAALSTLGCGTVANLAGAGPGKKAPFGGVKRDLQCLTEAREGAVALGTGQDWEPRPHEQQMLTVLCAADLPFSLIGDVITWPYTRAYTYINEPTDYPPLQVVAPPLMSTGPFTPVPSAPAVAPAGVK